MATHRATRDIIVIGASAGGLNALLDILRSLPADLPAALFVVVHMSADNPGALPALLQRAGPFESRRPRGRERVQAGTIYVAPPDHHLIVKRGYVCATRGPQENGFRPAVDPLFRTAAMAYGPRVIGVVLSGGLDDGTHGLTVIKRHGGIAIVQDPHEALVTSMPASALESVEIDHVARVSEMGLLLSRLTRQQVSEGANDVARRKRTLTDVAERGMAGLDNHVYRGPPSAFTCPGCGGALWELRDGDLIRYRCHVGHSYTAEALGESQSQNLEAALWSALRALEEFGELRRRMARRARSSNFTSSAHRYGQQAEEAELKAAFIRELLTKAEATPARDVDEPRIKRSAAKKRASARSAPPSAGQRGRMKK